MAYQWQIFWQPPWQQQAPNETLTDVLRRQAEAAQQEALRQAMLARQYPAPAFSPTVTINPNWAPFVPNITYTGWQGNAPGLSFTTPASVPAWDPAGTIYNRIQQQVGAPMAAAYNATYGAMPQMQAALAQAQAVDPMEAWWTAVSRGTPYEGIPYAGAESALGIGKLLGWGSGAGGPSALDWQRFEWEKQQAGVAADQWLREFTQRNDQLLAANLISQQQHELNKWQAQEQANQWNQQFQAAQVQQSIDNAYRDKTFDYSRAQQGWQNSLAQSQFDWQKSLEDWQKNFTANQAAQTQENWLREFGRQTEADAAGREGDRWARAFQQAQFDWQKGEADRQRRLQKELANYSSFGRRAAPVFSMM